MVLKIFLLVLFLIIIAIFVAAIANVFLPAVKNQLLKNTDLIFAPLEKNYVFRTVENSAQVSESRAAVLCKAQKRGALRFDYNGVRNCALIAKLYGSITDNAFDCVGYGDCLSACPQGAIEIQNGCAVVTDACCGCGACVRACPKNLIAMLPKGQKSIQYKNDGENFGILEIPEKKDFKFWKKWYRMLS